MSEKYFRNVSILRKGVHRSFMLIESSSQKELIAKGTAEALFFQILLRYVKVVYNEFASPLSVHSSPLQLG